MDGADDGLVALEGPVRVVAADDVDLANVGLDHPDDVLGRVLEGPRLARLPGEVAERAGEDTEVRRIDVAVDDEVDPVSRLRPLDQVGHAPETEEVVGLETGEAVSVIETLPGPDLLPHRSQAAIPEADVLGLDPRRSHLGVSLRPRGRVGRRNHTVQLGPRQRAGVVAPGGCPLRPSSRVL